VPETPAVDLGGDFQHWADNATPSEQVTVRSTLVGVLAVPALAAHAPMLDDDIRILKGENGNTSTRKGWVPDVLRLILLLDAKARAALEARRWYLIVSQAIPGTLSRVHVANVLLLVVCRSSSNTLLSLSLLYVAT